MNLYPDFTKCTVLVLGDVMLDRYFWGDVKRISPEAPVPIVKIHKKTDTLGGAGNVAKNLKELGCKTFLLGRIGADRSGKRLSQILKYQQIDNRLIIDSQHPTTNKTRVIGQGQQLLRLDEETDIEFYEPFTRAIKKTFDDLISEVKVVVLSDYQKGTLQPGLIEYVISRCREKNIPIFIDPKGGDWMRYKGATCITPNTKEFNLVVASVPDHENSFEQQASDIIKLFDLKYLLVTRGSKGLSLFYQNRNPFHIHAKAREVFDVSGAGDTVISVCAAARACGLHMDQAAELANTAAGIVVGKVGTQPVLHEELKNATLGNQIISTQKIMDFRTIRERVNSWRQEGKKVVFTNGCFDILHLGHIKLLHDAASEGDLLVVGLNSDDSVKRLKGDSRPVISQSERAALLSSLNCVDAVVIFGEDTPLKLITLIEPDIIVKGGDYTKSGVVGHEVVEKSGGKVVIVPLVNGVSTTKVIQQIENMIKEK